MPPRVPCDPACPCAGPTRCARHRRSPETFLGEQRVPCAAASCALGLCTVTSRLLPLPGVFPAFPVASPRRARRRARSSVLHGAGDALPESGLVWGRNRSAVSAAEPFWRVVCGSDPATEQSRSARGGAVLPSTLDHVWVGSAAEGLRDTRLLMVKRRDDGEKGGLPGCSPHSFQVKDGSPDPGHCQAVAHCAVFVSLRCPQDLFVALGDAHLDFLGGQVQLLLL